MFLKVVVGFLIFFLLGAGTGLMLELHRRAADRTHGRILFFENKDLLVPGIIMTLVLTLVYTFLTPIGPAVFSLFSGNGGLILFGGSVPVPIGGGLIVLMVMLFLGCTTGVILLCLIGILVAKLTDH